MHKATVGAGIALFLAGMTPGWGAHTQAKRLQTPQACGCGLPIAFDLEKQEFFCTGCGSSTQCTCRGPGLSPRGHPVKVV